VNLYSAQDTTQAPVRSVTGQITGYSSNGTGVQPYGTSPIAPVKSNRSAPQQNSSGQWIDTSTGQPYHGTYTDASGRPTYYSNGSQVGNAADVGVQQQNFSVSRTAKNPAISGAIDQLQTDTSAQSKLMSQSFNDYLSQANGINAQSKTQLEKDQAAFDTTGTENRVNAAASNQADALLANNRSYDTGQANVLATATDAARNYQAGLTGSLASLESGTALTADQLRKNNADYAANQNTVQGDIADNNKNYAATVSNRLANLSTNLTAQNNQYETDSQAVADQAYRQAQKKNDLYQLTSGTPTSGSGNLDNRYIMAYENINVPLQQQLADRRYQQVNQLDAANAQADAGNYQNLQSQYAGQSALNADLSNRGVSLDQYLQGLAGQNYSAETSTAGAVNQSQLALAQTQSGINTDIYNQNADTTKYIGQNDSQTAQYIQTLRQQTAGMSRAQAAAYLQQLSVPISVGQQVLSGQIQNQSALQGLDERANAYTFNAPYDTSRVPSAPGFNVSAPRSYRTGTSSAPSTSPTLSQALSNAGISASSPPAQGWVQGSDGNWYVPDATQKTGYRMVMQGQRSYATGNSNPVDNGYSAPPPSGTGYSGSADTGYSYSGQPQYTQAQIDAMRAEFQ
jgi:hypothetical protein